MSRSKNWACRAPVRHRKPGVFGGADALFGGADTLFGGADTLFGGADTLSPVHIYTHTHPAAPPKAHEPRFGGASVALRWRTRKPREATKPLAPPAPPK